MSDIAPQPTAPLTPQERYDAALAALRPRHRKFVIEYLRDLHQRNAAIRAGYAPASADSQASELRRNPKISAAIDAGMDLQAISASEILARLSAQARGNMADFLRVDEEEVTLTWSVMEVPSDDEGNPDMPGAVYDLARQQVVRPTERVLRTETVKRAVVRLDLLAAGAAGMLGLIKKYTVDKDGKITIELYDAQSALELLGKHRKLWSDDLGGILKVIDMHKLRPDQLERLSAGEDPLAVILGT
jgi:phage terminase small subunit